MPIHCPPELLRRVHRGAAAAERVEHEVAGVRGGGHDALEQCDGLLGGVAEAFWAGTAYCANIGPYNLNRRTKPFIKVILLPQPAIRLGGIVQLISEV